MQVTQDSTDIQLCRLCNREFHVNKDMINMFSAENKKLAIPPKILSMLTIMVTENDPTSNYICRICYKYINTSFEFINTSRTANNQIMLNQINVHGNIKYRDDITKVMQLPIASFYCKKYANVNGVYEALKSYMENPDLPNNRPGRELEDLIFHCSARNSDKDEVWSSNNRANDYGTPQSSFLQINNDPSNVTNNIGVNTKKNSYNKIRFSTNGCLAFTNANADHNYSVPHNTSALTNGSNIESPEVICLDDDDDDDVIEVSPLNNNLDTNKNNHNNTNHYNNNKKTYYQNIKSLFPIKQKIVPLGVPNILLRNSSHPSIISNEPSCTRNSSTISAEEMTVTPDMPLPDDVTNPIANRAYYIPPHMNKELTGSSLVTPETGFHFLYATDQTYDLTNTEQTYDLNSSNQTYDLNGSNQTYNLNSADQTCGIISTNRLDKKTKNKQKNSHKRKRKQNLTKIVQISSKKKCQDMDIVENQSLLPKPSSTIPTKNNTTNGVIPKLKSMLDKKIAKSVEPFAKPTTIPASTPAIHMSVKPFEKSTTTLASTFPVHMSVKPFAKPMITPVPTPTVHTSVEAFANTPATEPEVNIIKDRFGFWKLGNPNTAKYCTVSMERVTIENYNCDICDTLVENVKLHKAQKNEVCSVLSTNLVDDSVSTLNNERSTEQQEFLMYFKLVKKSSPKTTNQFANRKHIIKAFKKFGNSFGVYKCQFCESTSKYSLNLWTHMSAKHLQPITDKKSNSFCFVCDRVLSKRSKLLKHSDKCADNRQLDEITSNQCVVKLACKFCDEDINSHSHLERHLWDHISTQKKK